MYQPVLALALVLYGAAVAAAVAAFARPARPGTARRGAAERGLMVLAFLAHGVAIGAGCAELGGRHLLTGTGALGLAAWLAAGALVLLQRSLRSPAATVTVLPLVAATTFPGLFAVPAAGGATAPGLAALPEVRLHVVTAMAGLALLVVAAAVGVLFLLQHRQLKRKRLGPMLRRLPPLGRLERAGGAVVLAGAAAFTFALASGGLAAKAAWCATWTWDAQRIAAVGAWLVFAGLAAAWAVGVRGARQAVLAVGGLALVLVFLAGGRQGREGDPHARAATGGVLECGG